MFTFEKKAELCSAFDADGFNISLKNDLTFSINVLNGHINTIESKGRELKQVIKGDDSGCCDYFDFF